MFNNWIAQGLGKISAILAWALGSRQSPESIKTEIIRLTSSVLRQKNSISRIMKNITMVSFLKDTLQLNSKNCRSITFISSLSKQLTLNSYIKTEDYHYAE